jgi:excisionase family DNA binding protein
MRTLRNWLRQGRIPYRKVGRVVLIPKKALEDWANSHTLEYGSQARMGPWGVRRASKYQAVKG